MNKGNFEDISINNRSYHHKWLYVDSVADVEVTPEHPAYPIESGLLAERDSGWRAAGPGTQTIRIIFKHPQPLRRIWLDFHEPEVERTQEYVLHWSPDGGQSFQEIVRQQWNFSPHGSTRETENHHVNLPAVTVIELRIIPDISREKAFESLAQLRLI